MRRSKIVSRCSGRGNRSSDLLEGTGLRSLANGLVKALSQEVRTSKSTVSPAESIEMPASGGGN